MTQPTQTRPLVLKVLVGLMVFLGLGGVFGGLGFLFDPSGALMQLPLDLLSRTPFADYTQPGLFLFFILGVVPLVVAFALWKRPRWRPLHWLTRLDQTHWAWNASLIVSLILIVWIGVEYLMIGFHWLQIVFGVQGVVMLGLALQPAVRDYYAEG